MLTWLGSDMAENRKKFKRRLQLLRDIMERQRLIASNAAS